MQTSIMSHFTNPIWVRSWRTALTMTVQSFSPRFFSAVLVIVLIAGPVFAGWYNMDWKYRKSITIDHTRVSNTSQSDFPVLVNLAADFDLAGRALASGNDILFTASDGTTKLAYERDLFVSATGALAAWVKVPDLSVVSDTMLYMYYGNAAAVDQQERINVWDSNYKAVWHLKENATGAEFSEVLRPNAAGDETGISSQYPNSGAHWDKVNEMTADDGARYVYTTSTSYQNDLYKLASSTINQGLIKDVTVYFRFARNSSSRIAYARAYIKTHSTTYSGTEVNRASNTYETFSHTWANNPNTGLAWSWDEINSLQAGASIHMSSSSYNCRLTQVYVVVNGSPYLYQDSTANAKVAAPVNAPAQIAGKIDGALRFNGAASGRYADVISSPTTTLDNWTLQAWINPAVLPQGDASTATMALFNGNGSGGYGFGIGNGSGGSGNKLQGLYGTTTWHDSGYTFPAASMWYHVAMVRSAGTLSYYVNGTQTANTSGLTPSAVANHLTIGSQLSSAHIASRFFDGIIDEARIASTVRSADWLKTEYANQSNPSSFYFVSGQQGTNGMPTAVFDRLLVLLPGEMAAPGTLTGKTGTPLHQTADVAFNITVNAVDAEWYPINTVTDLVSIATSEPNADLPVAAPLVAGTQTFSVTLNMAGSWTVTATDETDGTKTPAISSLIEVGATIIQQFYLPMPEEQIWTAFNTIRTGSESPMVSVFSIVVTMPGTVITYDQWEDGYEANINSPANASTKVWGDGNNANGICPGFINDPVGLPAGTVLSLRNTIPVPRVPANHYYDGGDRIGATRPVTVTRACWAENHGPVRSVSVEVPGSLSHGKNFVAPVGINVSANDMFKYVGLMVMADEDTTQVIIDRDGPGGVAPTTTTIARGYAGALQVNGGISKGATVKSDKPVQVHMITGDPAGNLESRSFVLRPTELWSDQYIIPIGTENATYPCRAFLFNTNGTALTVSYTNQTGGGTLTVPANNGVLSYTLPSKSGTLLKSTGGRPFYVICAMNDVVSGDDNDHYDWGFAPLPVEGLTTEAVCGWGPGSANMPPTQNGSPVYVTPFSLTTVYIDYNGDRSGPLTDPAGGKYDVAMNLAAMQSAKVYDPDNDQTGMRLYTLDGVVIAAAWGIDPSVAGTGSPYLDMGYCLVPFPKVVFTKTSALVTDIDPPGLSLDDIMEYTLRVDNRSLLALGNSVLWDNLPPQLVYVPNSTYLITNEVTLAGFSVHDSVFGTPFPLDAPGFPIPVTPRGESLIFTFKCRIDGSGNIVNIGHFEDLVSSNAFVVVTPVTIRGAVLVDENGNGIRDGGEDDGLANVVMKLLNSSNVVIGTTLTDSMGAFEFSTNNIPGLEAGSYTLAETDPAGYLSTGPMNNEITVTVAAGQTSNANFFMDAAPAYTVTKTRLIPTARPAAVGEPVLFTLSVANTGNVALDPVALEDTYDPTKLSFVSASPNVSTAAAGLLTWANVGLLAAGESVVITTSFTAVQSTLPGATTNWVTSTAQLPMGIFVGAQTNHATVEVVAPACAITKEIVFPSGRPAAVGETTIFTITVSNTGDYLLSTVPVEDTFDSTLLTFVSATPPVSLQSGNLLTWANVGPLASGESTVITSRFGVVNAGMGINTVVTAPTTIDSVPIPPTTNSVPHEAVEPMVEVWKRLTSPAGRPAALGEEVRFTITVTNTSVVPIDTVPLTDEYDANLLAFISAVPMPTFSGSGLLTWDNVGPLEPGAYTSVTALFTAINSGKGRNTAISLTTTNDVPHTNVSPRVAILKTLAFPNNRPTLVGETNIFSITVSNIGDYPLYNIPVEDTYNTTLLSFVSATPPPSDANDDGVLNWMNVGPLAPGASTVITVLFDTVSAGVGTNMVVTVPTTIDNVPVLPETNSVLHEAVEPSLDVWKRVLSPVNRPAAIGEEVRFAITVTNTGKTPVYTVPLEDAYDNNLLAFVGATPSGYTAADGFVSWANLGQLAVGEDVTAHLWFTAITNGIGRNTAISLTTTNDIPHTNVNPRVSVVKAITFPTNRPTAIGETNTFTITVANTGDTVLDTVPVVDQYDASLLRYVSAVPAPSTHIGNFLTWNDIGPLATNGLASMESILVKFEALTPGTGTNYVIVTPKTDDDVPVPPATNSVPHINAGSSRQITKQIVAPTGRAAAIGETIEFSINVANTGDVPIFDVPVSDTYDTDLLSFVNATPSGYTAADGCVSWANLGPLAVGEDATAHLWFTAITNGIARNYAISLTTTNDIPHTNVNPRVSVMKNITFPVGRPTAVGETNTFTITVRNIGDTVLDTVPVTDTYNSTLLSFVSATPEPNMHIGNVLTWNDVGPLGTNAFDDVATILVEFEALASGSGTNWVIVTPKTDDDVPVPPATNSVPHINADSSLRVTKKVVTPTGRAAAIGEQIQFSIDVKNTGDVPIFNVPLEDAYDSTLLSFVNATPSGYTAADGFVSWANIGPLAVGADFTAELWFTAITNGIGRNYAISLTTTNDIPHTNVNPRVSVVKDITFPVGRPTAVGETNTFTITVRNIGDTVLDTVPVTDTYDTNLLSFVSATPEPNMHIGNVLTWNNVGPLGTNAFDDVATILVQFEALASGSGTNWVIVTPKTDDDVPVPPVTNSVPHINADSSLRVTKKVVTPTGRAAAIGESIQFSIDVMNTGDVPIFNVPLEDAYDSTLLSFVNATPSSYTAADGCVSWANLGPLAVGEDVTAHLWFTAITNGIGRNYATSLTTTNDIPHTNVNPRVSVVKDITFPVGRPTAIGETNTFAITISNIGDTVLDTVPVTDTYNGTLLKFVSATPPPSTSIGNVLTWNDVGPLGTNAFDDVATILVEFEALASGSGTNWVIVTPKTDDDVPVPPATNSVPHINADSSLRVTKKVVTPTGRAAAIGETIEFSINVANTGDVPIFDVPVSDTYDTNLLSFVNAMPLGYTAADGRVSWENLGPLAVGEDVTAHLWFTAITNGIGRNYAISLTTTNDIPHTNVNPRVSVVKDITLPVGRPTAVGETNTFTITVRNIGDTVLDTVPVTDTYNSTLLKYISATPLPDTRVGNVLTWDNVGRLGTNALDSVATILVKFEALAPGEGTNWVIVTPKMDDDVPVPPATNSVPHVNADSSLRVTKKVVTPTGRAAAIGETIEFSINVANTGDVPIFDVPVSDTYDTNLLSFVNAMPLGYTAADGRVSWENLGPLAVGEDVTAHLWFTAITNGIGRNYATSLTTTNDIPHTNVNPRVSVVKDITFPVGRPTAIGETNTFTITVRNIGDTVLDTVPVTDTYDTNLLSFVSAMPAPTTYVGNVLTWNNVGQLATNGTSSTATILVQFEALASGSGTNWVIVTPKTDDDVPVPPATNSVPHVNVDPHVSITKRVVAPASCSAQINEHVVFQITVMNQGDIPLDVVPVDDFYLSHFLTYVNSDPPTDDNQNDGALRWSNVGPLAPGTTTNLFATFIARAGTSADGEINTVVTAPRTHDGVPILPMTNSAIYWIDDSIDVDNVSVGAFRFTPTGRMSHTVLAGSTNRVLVVGVSVNNTPEMPGVVTNVCYGGVPLTLAGSRANVDKVASIWVMTNPPEGTLDVVVRCNMWPGEGFVVGAMTLRNVDQVNPYGTFVSSVGESGNPTITGMSSALGEFIVDTVALQGTDLAANSSEQVPRWVKSSTPLRSGRHYATGGGSTKAGANNVDMSWTVNPVVSSNWAMGALAFRPHKTRATSQTVLISSLNPSELGKNVTFTATVTGAVPSPMITGKVQFRIDGLPIGDLVDLWLGVASLEVTGLEEGVHNVSAQYLGDQAFECCSCKLLQNVHVTGEVPDLVITAIRIENEHAVVEWPGVENWFYTVDRTPSLSPFVPWTHLLPHVGIPGLNGLMSITDTNKLSGACFYRVKMSQ